MTILCFLQNMWVRDPEKVRDMLKKRPELWERMVPAFLFSGCLTGRRIKSCFGDLLEHMIFEEATKEIAGDSRTICDPDPEHIKACLEKHKPRVVVAFGRVATAAVGSIWVGWSVYERSQFISCPHPVARQKNTVERLKKAAKEIRKVLK